MTRSARFEALTTRFLVPELRLSTAEYPHPNMLNGETGPQAIYDGIISGKPFFVGRFGSTELLICLQYLALQERRPSSRYRLWRSLLGGSPFSPNLVRALENGAGFFPGDDRSVCRFANCYLDAASQLDVLASWMRQEKLVAPYIEHAKKMPLEALVPFVSEEPWSKALEGKRVLVVHPFADSIKKQYEKRERLFRNPAVLPNFHLEVLPAVQSIGGGASGFATWFDALGHMKEGMESRKFDVAILGCGAYGLPLGAFAKKLGKQAIHMGGVTQCLFGIKGRRWEEDYGWDKLYFNESWVYPDASETPSVAQSIESGCYWGPAGSKQ